MIAQTVLAARQELILRELLERAELREMFLRALGAFPDDAPLGFAEASLSAPLNRGEADTQTALPAPAAIRSQP